MTQAKCHIKTGDNVIIISGKNKGKTGQVLRVWPDKQRALVDGEASIMQKKHVRADPQRQVEGGIVERLRPIHVSNLALVDPQSGKATRVRRDRSEGKVVRVAVKSGEKIA
jgi:large subunit ribosomal protein L24